MGVLESALKYVDRGFHIFPSNKKLPALKDWPTLASNDPIQVTEWFENDFKWVDGFGVCPKNTCVVIDVDVKDGKRGLESLRFLIDELKLPKQTLVVRTKSGGLHLYYKYPSQLESDDHIKSVANWKLRSGVVLDGIDIRGNKGQVVGPTDTNGYVIVSDKPLATLPESIVDHLPVDRTGGLQNLQSTDSLVDETASSGLRGIIPDIIHEGNRHETLLSLTASWARKVPYETAKILLKEAINRCEGDDIDYESYLERLDDAYSKFKPVIEDKLQWMLDNLVFVIQGNRIYRADMPANSATIRIEEARNMYRNWVIFDETEDAQGNTKVKATPAFERWLLHPDRQSVENIGYRPTTENIYMDRISGVEVINTYRPPEIEIDNESVPNSDVKPFIELVEFLWEENAEIMLDVCAHLIQRPEFKMHWCPLLITPHEGMGKNLFFLSLATCLGRWNTGTINASQFNKSFNTFLVENLVTVISEVQEVSKKDRQVMMGKLKNYITESEQPIEGKGANIYVTEIYANFIIFSNIIDALYIEDGSRRFFVHVNHNKPKEQEFYQRVVDWMAAGGPQQLYNWFMQRDISDFKPVGFAPVTSSKTEVVEANMSDTELSIMEDIENHNFIFRSDIVTSDSWHYYINNILHKGARLSVAHEKHLKTRLFQSVKYLGGTSLVNKGKSTRQCAVRAIGSASDAELIIRGPGSIKQSLMTCRNHGKYDAADIKEIKAEYEKIFLDDESSKSTVSLIRGS